LPSNSAEYPVALDERTLRMIAYISGLGGLALSVLYLFGFWESFGLNVLEFIGFSDVLAHALFPILVLIAAQVIPFVAGRLTAASRAQSPPPDALVQFGRKYWWWLAVLCVVGCFLALGLMSEPERSLISIAFLCLFLLLLVSRAVQVGELKAEMRPLVSLVILLTFYVFVNGRMDAYQIIDGEGALVVDRSASKLMLNSNDDNSLSYVGHLSDFYVLYEPKIARIIILRTDKIGPLVMFKNPKLQPEARATAPSSLPTPTLAPARS
jgi:hypothetical protein